MKAGAEGSPSAPAFFISFYSRNRSMGCRRQACKRAQSPFCRPPRSSLPRTPTMAKAVSWAVENGVTEGAGSGLFAPNSDCTRADRRAPAPLHALMRQRQRNAPFLRAVYGQLSIFLKNFDFWVRVFPFFCTYISEGTFKPYFQIKSEGRVQSACTIPQDESSLSKGGCAK